MEQEQLSKEMAVVAPYTKVRKANGPKRLFYKRGPRTIKTIFAMVTPQPQVHKLAEIVVLDNMAQLALEFQNVRHASVYPPNTSFAL